MESKNNPSCRASCIAVLGTGSDVGKSVVTTALCRLFADRGMRVSPYKAQNMSNNSGVTPEGLEMGRAQIVQAEAARISPHVDMNPILLKPTSEIGSQIVLLGEVLGNSTALDYHLKKEHLCSQACAALDRLREAYDLVVLEGAGSCAEVNLQEYDIVNFRMAEYADAPVILVADIHRGGVFAQIVGTLECLSPLFRDRIAGFIINRFRGDIRLFEAGTRWIEEKTGKPVFGVLPWYTHFHIEDEDSVVIESRKRVSPEARSAPSIAVIRIPHISNFTDFDPLCRVNGLEVFFLEQAQDLSAFRAVILPGSKNTRFDMEWLGKTGWSDEIRRYAGNGGHVLGICGGYQMMGSVVHDPQGLEGKPGTSPGLGLLPVETILKAPKTTTRTRFSWGDLWATGYEIHMGQTLLSGGKEVFQVKERNGLAATDMDGCATDRYRIMGTYIHGLFDTPGITTRWLESLGIQGATVSEIHGLEVRDREYGLLAEHFRKHVDVESIWKLAMAGNSKLETGNSNLEL